MQGTLACSIILLVKANPEDIAAHLLERKLSVGTVESATGGLISNLFTNVAGSSHFFLGTIVAYSNEIKTRVVGVDPGANINAPSSLAEPHVSANAPRMKETHR